MSVTIRKVETRADFKAFFTFPWTVYKDDPHWVPPLLSIRRETLDRKKNPAWEYLEGDYFTAWRGETIVGTIAAFVNHRHNEFHDENIAWFGFFEAENDPEAAAALLQTAFDWARSRGYNAVRGPQSFTTHEETGLLVDGFERPILLMPYNPPYYQRLIEGQGFHKVMDTYSYYYNWALSDGANMDERIAKVVQRVERTVKATLRPINRKKLREDFALFKELYNKVWEKNWGFVPMTPRELDQLIKSLGMIFDPRLACFVEVGGEPIGFMLGVPDFNQPVQRAYPRPGVPEPLTLLRVLFHWKLRPTIDWMRIPLMGIREEYRNRGLELLMLSHFYRHVRTMPYKHLDCGWILETNQAMNGVLQGIGCTVHRTYRYYEKATI
jgi:hypothetical protein